MPPAKRNDCQCSCKKMHIRQQDGKIDRKSILFCLKIVSKNVTGRFFLPNSGNSRVFNSDEQSLIKSTFKKKLFIPAFTNSMHLKFHFGPLLAHVCFARTLFLTIVHRHTANFSLFRFFFFVFRGDSAEMDVCPRY